MTAEEFITEWLGPSPWITAHTSGSTGEPKEIRLAKSFVRRSALRTIDFFRLDSTSRLHLALSPDYIAGKMMIVRALESGARLTAEPPSNNLLADSHDHTPVSLLAVVPSQLDRLLLNDRAMERVRNIIVGGGRLPSALVCRCTEARPAIYETYGMTETASHVAIRRAGADSFNPLPGICFGLDDRGCLVITFDTGERFVTNDMARLTPDGGMNILGRIDNVIITGGMKVHPELVEAKIESVIGPRRFYITSEQDAKWGEALCLVVEDPCHDLDAAAVSESLRRLLPGHERPKKIVAVESLARTASGKIIRRSVASGG